MDENEMNLDEPATRRDLKELETELTTELAATRRDLKELETATRRDLKELKTELKTEIRELVKTELANYPTRAETDASFRQCILHIESVREELLLRMADHADGIVAQLTQHANAIAEDNRRSFAALDDRYSDLPACVTKLETAV